MTDNKIIIRDSLKATAPKTFRSARKPMQAKLEQTASFARRRLARALFTLVLATSLFASDTIDIYRVNQYGSNVKVGRLTTNQDGTQTESYKNEYGSYKEQTRYKQSNGRTLIQKKNEYGSWVTVGELK